MNQRVAHQGYWRWWLLAPIFLLALVVSGGIVLVLGMSSAFETEITPFKEEQMLADGTHLTVEGKVSAGFAGTCTSYKLWIQRIGHTKELVDVQDVVLGRQGVLPSETARVIFQGDQQFLLLGKYIYWRDPQAKIENTEQIAWQKWSYDSEEVRYFGRALMPVAFARNEKFDQMWLIDSPNFPLPPIYQVERLDGKQHILILRRGNSGDFTNSWPPHLVFTSSDQHPNDWHVDLDRTQAIKGNKALRPFPGQAQVEILVMNLPEDYTKFIDPGGETNASLNGYKSLTSLPGAKVLRHQQFAVTKKPYPIVLPSWWSQKTSPVTMTMRSICSDPNPKLLHLKWQINNELETWAIAREGIWRELRESSCALASPYVFIRWKRTPMTMHVARHGK